MNKLTKILSLVLMAIPFVGCDSGDKVELQILSFNDYHGAVRSTDTQAGLELFASNIIKKKNEYKDRTVILSAGDMYQGSAESNIGHGKVLIDVMNEVGLDAMTVGNHEFDWGIDTLKSHHDGNQSNGEANYDYLGCNIYENESNTRVDWAADYKIISRKNVNIGVIGWIGSDCVNDIATSIIKPYSFTSPYERIIEIAKDLRTNKECDIIVAMGHEQDELLNQSLSMNEEAKIDLIINGHSHQSYVNEAGSCNIIQSGTVGQNIGVTKISFDKKTKSVTAIRTENEMVDYSVKKDSGVSNILNKSLEEVNPIINRVIGKAKENIDRTTAANWAAKVTKASTGADLGIINWGGIRSTAFPIRRNEDIKVAKVWEIMPFDNVIKTVKLTGRQIKGLVSNDDSFVFSDDVDYMDLLDDDLYLVAACDYIFDKPKYVFSKGEDVTITPLLVRDALIADIEDWTKEGKDFEPSKGTKVANLLS